MGKRKLEVHNDEFNDSTKVYIDNVLVYESKRVKSMIQLHEVLDSLKEEGVEYETIYHNYLYA